ncbi:MAG: hypothetical protein IJJ99_10610 [Oscillospiraceae bacterium]|nr:hypothetical protein [Oscillospiraceae bacterium]
MAKKNTQKKQNSQNNDTKITIIVIAFAVLIIAAIAALVLFFPKEPDQQPEPPQTELTQAPTESTEEPTQEPTEDPNAFPFEIPGFTLFEDVPAEIVHDQLCILGVGSYSGPYFEDGSDESVTDVLAIVVENIREDWVENADLILSCDGETAHFSVSALPGHRCAILLEQDRMVYADGMEISNPVCTFCTNDMTGKNEDFTADFSLEPYEGDILVFRNVSGHDFTGDAVLYYKTVAPYGLHGELLYLGGIAYTYCFDGPIAADEMRQANPAHYSIGGSAILFMSYDS